MKTIMLRNIPKDVVQIVGDHKAYHSIKTNTDAIVSIIRLFADLEIRSQAYLSTMNDLGDDLEGITEILETYTQSKAAVHINGEAIKKFLSNEFKKRGKG